MPLKDVISIHALLAESDVSETLVPRQYQNFYPRSPCGERRKNLIVPPGLSLFLSTLSLRRATNNFITAKHGFLYFYPRSPCGERQKMILQALLHLHYFYPRSPCGERPIVPNHTGFINNYFYPRSPCGERLETEI